MFKCFDTVVYSWTHIGVHACVILGDFCYRYHTVLLMGEGQSPTEAAREVITRIGSFYPEFNGAIIAVNVTGGYGE